MAYQAPLLPWPSVEVDLTLPYVTKLICMSKQHKILSVFFFLGGLLPYFPVFEHGGGSGGVGVYQG